jgi:Leucine-rich repeat (LRR) protein
MDWIDEIWYMMNDDVIFELFRFLPIEDIVNCSLVNKQFYRVTKNEVLWKGNVKEVIKFDGSYYESFKFNYGLERVKIRLCLNGNIRQIYTYTFISPSAEPIIVPTYIGLLQNLRSLNLFCNSLTSIPSELGLLQNLKTLNLSNNFLTSIPSELGLLQNLQSLYLSGNKLTFIPSELGNLKNVLITLYDNPTTYIPDEIYQNSSIKIEK